MLLKARRGFAYRKPSCGESLAWWCRWEWDHEDRTRLRCNCGCCGASGGHDGGGDDSGGDDDGTLPLSGMVREMSVLLECTGVGMGKVDIMEMGCPEVCKTVLRSLASCMLEHLTYGVAETCRTRLCSECAC